MRKPKTYYATRGHLTAGGTTKTMAKASLDSMVDWACTAPSTKVEIRFGLVLIVSATASGYETRVFNPATMLHGQEHICCTCFGQIDYGTALQSARIHAAQNAWTHAVADDSEFVMLAQVGDKASELASWIRFQRSYAAAKRDGRTDAEAFNLANGLPIAA